MIEKIIPVLVALIALQFIIRFISRKKPPKPSAWRDLDYKRKIDELMKIGNFDDVNTTGKSLQEEVKSRLATADLYMEIPDNMRDVRRGLNLVIDAVITGVKAKGGEPHGWGERTVEHGCESVRYLFFCETSRWCYPMRRLRRNIYAFNSNYIAFRSGTNFSRNGTVHRLRHWDNTIPIPQFHRQPCRYHIPDIRL